MLFTMLFVSPFSKVKILRKSLLAACVAWAGKDIAEGEPEKNTCNSVPRLIART
jgi:hypothetical protein